MKRALFGLAAAILFACGSVNAQVVTFAFEGNISLADPGIAPIASGDKFHGQISWVANEAPGYGLLWYYYWPPLRAPGATVTVDTSLGPVTFAQDPDQPWYIAVMNDYDLSSNGRLVDEIQYFGNVESRWRNVQFRLRDETHTVLSDLGLPGELELSAFNFAAVTVTNATGGWASGPITSLTRLTENLPPSVTFGAPADGAAFAVNAPVGADVLFFDGDSKDTHTCVLDWGDGSTGYNGTCTQIDDLKGETHSYSKAGVYTVAATVTDNHGSAGYAETLVVVYDPTAGFVSGGGWIDSPQGAYTYYPDMTGTATFGFVAKYKKGANAPDGATQFIFQAGDMRFHSNSYEWLVVAGGKAQFKGVGTIGAQGNYGFLIVAKDAESTPAPGDADTFRIRIWDISAGDYTVYDNLTEQTLGGGSITIQTGDKN